jgi:sulfoxide reductase heme-binding subunit YedZ
MLKLAKPVVFLLALTPFAWLVFRTLTGRLSANPIEDIELTTGIWALRCLVATLAITPVRRVTGWNPIIQYRRMLGLFAFFYASVHFLTYLVFDQVGDLNLVLKDVAKRPFITMGTLAFALMIPLALTSTRGWIRRLGRRWQLLHRLVYISGIAAAIHYLWKVKVAIGSPVYYAIVIAILLAFRVAYQFRTKPVGQQRVSA